ncbi:Clp amino terminal domain-containing protein, pathogenicity island component [Streptomyces sp. yr375]|uniref:Clp protease N-terminal domain-containing protein n=1 Tax=Streptomyces sp. yr375 TaxID=1761906 RepID=UPI0008B1502A|nr:Clp protease N-terminal domain-containing protein [Streptomyces sp. yr375]SES36785.1 Clp amino terminal domain-containing protein, pathogenicity island component [Streptomyces sp. yr375]
MFERFTQDARAVVRAAVAHAERAGAERVEETHVLLALLDREGSRGSFALASLGLPSGGRDGVVRDLVEVRRRGGLSRADMDALSGLGIDVSEIVSRVEEAHGEGALAAEGGGRSDCEGEGEGRGKGEGGGRFGSRFLGRRPFDRGARDLLTDTLRIALGRHERSIGDEHLLLALTARRGAPSEILADHGVTYTSVTRVLGTAG